MAARIASSAGLLIGVERMVGLARRVLIGVADAAQSLRFGPHAGPCAASAVIGPAVQPTAAANCVGGQRLGTLGQIGEAPAAAFRRA